MKRFIYIAFIACLMSLIYLSGFSYSIPAASAQGCTVIDTIIVNTHATTFTGSVNTKAGRLYEYRISGTADNGALTVRDAFWATTSPTPWASQFQSYNFSVLTPYIQAFDGSWPAYSPTHEYTVEA
jgi:hypothetical protein